MAAGYRRVNNSHREIKGKPCYLASSSLGLGTSCFLVLEVFGGTCSHAVNAYQSLI